MFSDSSDTVINYYIGSPFNVPERNSPMTDEARENSQLNLARFMTVRTNCNTACSKLHLSELSEDERNAYIENAKTAQNNLKKFNNDLSAKFDSCIRSCFGNKNFYILLSSLLFIYCPLYLYEKIFLFFLKKNIK